MFGFPPALSRLSDLHQLRQLLLKHAQGLDGVIETTDRHLEIALAEIPAARQRCLKSFMGSHSQKPGSLRDLHILRPGKKDVQRFSSRVENESSKSDVE